MIFVPVADVQLARPRGVHHDRRAAATAATSAAARGLRVDIRRYNEKARDRGDGAQNHWPGHEMLRSEGRRASILRAGAK
jgi:hypothetical protein